MVGPKKLEIDFVERPVFLPPEASKLVLAAALDGGSDFRPNWEIAVMKMAEPLSMRSIARSEGGYVDEVQGAKVAWTPSDAYFATLSDGTMGVCYPANRQYVSRWIQAIGSNPEMELSEYLTQAIGMRNDKIQVVQAIDLSDLAPPHEIDDKVRQSKLFEQAKLSPEDAVQLLTSLRGAMLRLAIDTEVRAELQISFARDASPLASIAKPLVLEALGELGVEIPDMAEWKSKVDGKDIKMMGKVSKDSLRRLFSVVELPSAKFSLLKDDGEVSSEPSESKMLENSLVYFRSVDTLLRDLKRELGGNQGTTALLDRYARKIDRMPILNVDPSLLDYGSDVAETLRMVSLARKQGGIQAGVATAGMGGGGYGNYSYNYGYRGSDRYAGARQSAADRSAYKAQALAASRNLRAEGAKLIADASAAIRREMTEKYQVEF